MVKWLSTRDFAKLIEDQFPATEDKVRNWCEAGDIPPEIAKRDPSKAKKRGQWSIKANGIRWILEHFLKLSPPEVAEVQKKSPVNFNQEQAA